MIPTRNAVISGTEAGVFGSSDLDGMIELPLLLPVRRAEALVALSRARKESVGQILRQWIEEMLAAGFTPSVETSSALPN